MKKVIALLFLVIAVLSASSQTIWDQAWGNLYSNVPGYTIITTPANFTNSTRLAITPSADPGGIGMIIGEPNTGTGGFTSLSAGISARQNGYGYLQAIKASGSSWGNIVMNLSGGSVGIGTTETGSFKLAVEGGIGARLVKVTAQSPWPDYVFNKDYQLMSLASLEVFIKKNNHLPNVPSAATVKAEGIDLGDMNAKLLEKIEELTLHVIELSKKVEALEKEKQAAPVSCGKQ
ncbi:MAG: hypothetical protein J7621_09030 [Niastella sp.]|nr:hypothetical protein [Niastella sp.]